ncbi:hypothetical protein O181_012217 [Austropuccinia psidii MF-1]|uniref:Uncharacterized protein n=1 Tax=Austropuccinia psidii MF-1 TaxID=1389203 RepID=A0A9Q3BX92_9BASI|nr:hypothetical protein [Austropuccinia psidii MF-1]
MVQGSILLSHRNRLLHPPSSSPPAANAYAQEKICFNPRHQVCPITHPCAATVLHLTMLTLLKCPLDVLLPAGTTSFPSPILKLPHPCLILSTGKHAYAHTLPYRYSSDPLTHT